MMTPKRRLLILPCSARKSPRRAPVRAIDRYDGPLFRVLRKFHKYERDNSLDLFVLSAKFGLIAGNTPIPRYDRYLTLPRLGALRTRVAEQFRTLGLSTYSDGLVLAGRRYLSLLPPEASWGLRDDSSVSVVGGPLGRQLTTLHSWLYPADVFVSHSIRGVEIPRSEALMRGLRRAKALSSQGQKLVGWYADLEGVKVSPKWLVSQLSGRAVSTFHSQFARRYLTSAGVPVGRI